MMVKYQATKEITRIGDKGVTIAKYDGPMGCDYITEVSIPLSSDVKLKYTYQEYDPNTELEDVCVIQIDVPDEADSDIKYLIDKGANCVMRFDPAIGINTLIEAFLGLVAVIDELPELKLPDIDIPKKI